MQAGTQLNIAVVTVSDTRTEETDTSGNVLVEALESAGHSLHSKIIIKDDVYDLRASISAHIADPKVNAILTTGGTGFTCLLYTSPSPRDVEESGMPGWA